MMLLHTVLHFVSADVIMGMTWPLASGGLSNTLNTLATNINTIVTVVGGTVFLISVAVAGIMRMVAFGNERRIALSNMALTAAVVGLLIMLLAGALGTFVKDAIK